MPKLIPQKHRDKMVKLYQKGLSAKKASKKVGCSAPTCLEELRRRGLNIRPTLADRRRYLLDETFFDKINTEEKAYWLGFITADGSIEDTYRLKIRLKYGDKKHLKKFLTAVKANNPIRKEITSLNDKLYPMASVAIGSKRMILALSRLGVWPRKSFTIKPCARVPKHLLHHYWRGLVDGDGSLSKLTHHPKRYNISLVGNKAIVSGFWAWIVSFIRSNAKPCKQRTIWSIGFTGSFAKTIVEHLYKDANVYLDRKYKIAQKILDKPEF